MLSSKSDITPPDKGRYVTDSDTAGLLARHEALLERVTVLERALEQIATNDPMDLPAQEIAERALDG